MSTPIDDMAAAASGAAAACGAAIEPDPPAAAPVALVASGDPAASVSAATSGAFRTSGRVPATSGAFRASGSVPATSGAFRSSGSVPATSGAFRTSGSVQRSAILEAARAGRSPEGGPSLTRGEVEILRTGAPPQAFEAILASRVADWALRDASDEFLAVAVEGAKRTYDALDRAHDELSWANDLINARTVLAARLALARTLARRTGTPDPSSVVGLIEGPASADLRPRAVGFGTGSADAVGAGKPAAAKPNRLPILLGVLAASALLLLLRPSPLVEPRQAPPPGEISSSIDIGELRVVGDQLHATAPTLRALEPSARSSALQEACGRAEALGFRGMVFLDGEGVVDKCLKPREGK